MNIGDVIHSFCLGVSAKQCRSLFYMAQKITRRSLEKFLSRHASDERVLDIGSGGSSYGRFFPNRISVDIDPKRGPDIVGDAHDLPFKDGEFTFVLCTEVLEHVQDPKRAILEMRRVLSLGGTLVLTTRFVYPLHDSPGDYWRFTKYGLQELFKEWDIVELVPETQTFSAIAVLLQRLTFQTRLRFNKITKAFLTLLAYLFDRMNFFVVEEYGDIQRNTKETDIMSSGYYIVCKKK